MTVSLRIKEYAIRYLSEVMDMPSESIAKELKMTIKSIDKVILKKEAAKCEKIETPVSTTKKAMIRHTSGKNSNSVSIMTEAASQLGDHFKKNHNGTKGRDQSHIFRPNGD